MRVWPVVMFYLLTIVISWLGWAPALLGARGVTFFRSPIFQVLLILPTVGPTLAAVIVNSRTGDRKVKLFAPLIRWRVPLQLYVIAIALPILLLLIARQITRWFDLPTVTYTLNQGNRIATIVTAFIVAIVANPWEEVGWRGFALPNLQPLYGAFRSSLIVGLMWGVWHLPLFLWPGNPMSERSFWIFLGYILASACIYTWLYNNANASLLIVTIYHVAWNTFGAAITGVSDIVLGVENWIVAIVLFTWLRGGL